MSHPGDRLASLRGISATTVRPERVEGCASVTFDAKRVGDGLTTNGWLEI